MRVLRITSVFENPGTVASRAGGAFDPIGGMQTHTAALSRQLDRLGVTQDVLTTRPPGTARREPLGRLGLVRRMGLPVPWCRQGFAAAVAATVHTADLPEYDLIHVHLGEDPGLAAATLGVLQVGPPVIVTVHTSMRHTLAAHDPRSRFARHVGGRIERTVKRRASAVVTLTQRAAAYAIADGARPDDVHVIPSGFDEVRFAAIRPDTEVRSFERPIVGYLGRLHPQKDVETLLRAAKSLRGAGSVVIVGDGPDNARLRDLARALGVTDRVRFLGAVPHHRVPDVLAGFDVLAVPSRYEELGSVVIEAMRVGVPVVASRTGGLPEAVVDGVTGFLVPPGDPLALARGLDHVIGDRAVRLCLSSNAKSRARAYSWTHLAERVLDVYCTVSGVQRPPCGLQLSGLTASRVVTGARVPA